MQSQNLSSIKDQQYCRYYQAHVIREQAWFFVAIARSYEHVMFDRTLDAQTSTFEFFVPADMEDRFLTLMSALAHQGVVEDLRLCENRLIDPTQVV